MNCSLVIAIQQPHNQTNTHLFCVPYNEEQPLPISCSTIQNVNLLLQPLRAPGVVSLLPAQHHNLISLVLEAFNALFRRLQLRSVYKIACTRRQRNIVHIFQYLSHPPGQSLSAFGSHQRAQAQKQAAEQYLCLPTRLQSWQIALLSLQSSSPGEATIKLHRLKARGTDCIC